MVDDGGEWVVGLCRWMVVTGGLWRGRREFLSRRLGIGERGGGAAWLWGWVLAAVAGGGRFAGVEDW